MNAVPKSSLKRMVNPRQFRVIQALLKRSRKRSEIDTIAGACNGPGLIAQLRRQGFAIPCGRIQVIDRDGYSVRIGVYEFTQKDRRKAEKWLEALQ